MRVRSITTCALGLAAALSFASTLAAQQDTSRLRRTTSEQRINVSKGEVAPVVRVDTVFITRIDTVRISETVTRVDTVTVAAPVVPVLGKVKGNTYWAMFGGSTRPYGNIDRVYTNGFHAGGAFGWESQHSMWGLRLDGAMNQLGREETLLIPGGYSRTNVGSGTPLMLHLAADVKLAPVTLAGWKPYVIGGPNYTRYRGIALSSSNSQGPNDFFIRGESYKNASESWSDKFGFNFGAGLDFHIGSQDMFLEYRWVATRAYKSNSYINPISLGLRFF